MAFFLRPAHIPYVAAPLSLSNPGRIALDLAELYQAFECFALLLEEMDRYDLPTTTRAIAVPRRLANYDASSHRAAASTVAYSDEGIEDNHDSVGTPSKKSAVNVSDTKEWRRDYMRKYRAEQCHIKRQAKAEVRLAEAENQRLTVAVTALRREADALRALLQQGSTS